MKTQFETVLEEIELNLCQARLANSIGKNTKQRQIDFLLFSMELMEKRIKAALGDYEARRKRHSATTA